MHPKDFDHALMFDGPGNDPLGTTDFRPQATFWIAVSGLALVTPFAVNNLLERRAGLGIASLAIVALLVANAWQAKRGRWAPGIPLLTLLPVIVVFLAVALVRQREIGLLWCYPAVLALYCMLPERWALIGNGALLAVALPTIWQVFDPSLASRASVTLFAVSLFSAILVRVISRQQQRLHRIVITDHLTGCRNRVTLGPVLASAIERARAAGSQATLLAIDIDHFKRINDDFGHATGDHVLRTVGTLLRDASTAEQIVFRTGGEEFLLLLPGVDHLDAAAQAERLRRAVTDAQPLATRRVSVSLGVAVLTHDDDANSWMCRADDALYLAKGDGRDRVALAA